MDIDQAVTEILALTEGVGAVNLQGLALNWPAAENEHGYRHVWESLSYDRVSAEQYLSGLTPEDANEEAAIALAGCGWTRSKINTRRS